MYVLKKFVIVIENVVVRFYSLPNMEFQGNTTPYVIMFIWRRGKCMDNKCQQLVSYFGVKSKDIYLFTSRLMDQIYILCQGCG